MIRAIARIETSTRNEACFRILTCPADPSCVAVVFAAPREVSRYRVGEHVVVKFSPDDQFAYECKEALEP